MTTIVHENVDVDSLVVRINELTAVPIDCTFYRADLLKGFALSSEVDIYGTSVHPCVSPLHHDGRAILVPKSVFSGEILRVGWVDISGMTIFRWYVLDRDNMGNSIVWQVEEFIQQKRDAVIFQTVMVPDRR